MQLFKKNTNKVKVMALGGLNEIGKNMTVIEYKDEIVVIDAGLSFPEDEMLGVDIVIPDITYLLKNKDKVKGIFITHGHEDHIGALPYILKKIDVPVYGTRFSIGLIEAKLKEHKLNNVKLNVVTPKQTVKLKNISVEFIKNNHSIQGACSIAVHTDQGIIYHTGDFKIDLTPIDGDVMDIHRICELGSSGVLLMLADSTNVEKPGFTMSERTVGAGLDDLFRKANGSRIIVATFASNVHRLQQIINMAVKFNRKVAISGRSMVNVIGVARELGYLDMEDETLIDLNDISKYDDNELVIITTGTQGEPMSALARMSSSEHKKVEIKKVEKTIYSNVKGLPYEEQDDIRFILKKHIMSSGYFEKEIEDMLNKGVNTFVEVGPGKALRGFVKKIDRNSRLLNVEDIKSLENTLNELKEGI